MTAKIRAFGAVAIAVGIVLTLGACRAEEQSAPFIHQKGVYAGPTEPPLSDSVKDQLRNRTRLQGGADMAS